MAGSYRHCCNEDGTFNREDFIDMIENLGDAHEACEMMHWMIDHLAEEVSKFGYLSSMDHIQNAEEAYYRWLREQHRIYNTIE